MEESEDPTRPDALWLDAWRGALYATSRVLRIAEAELIATEGFPITWLDILALLYDAPDHRMRMQELQERSLFTRSGITRLIDRIEAAELVRREPVPKDRRGVLVALTDEGHRRHAAAFASHLPVIEREFGRVITPEQQRVIADAFAAYWRDARAEPD